MKPVRTSGAPEPGGHYSQAMVHEGLVYVSGQLPVDPATGQPVGGSVERQTEQALRNVEAILEAAGSGLDHLLQVTVYIPDVGQWPAVNETYRRILGDHRPARAVVPTRELHHGVAVEIQAIAALRR